MRQLSDNLLANVKLALLVLTGLIVVVSGIGIFVSIYNSMADRRREIGIMRALGARRQTVFSIILLESLLLCVVGGLLGVLLGHGLVFAGSPIVAARSGLLINPYFMDPLEFVIIPVMIVMASIVGFLPAMSAYRTDVAQALSQ
jgi:putative ABC transport system permease protein